MNAGAAATSAVITGLVNNTNYFVRVAAQNAQGQGLFAGAPDSVSPRALSAAPTRLTGLAGNSTVSLVWTAPQPSAAAGPVIDYVIQGSTNYTGDVNAAAWVTFSDGVSTLTRVTEAVTNGKSYVFRVAAVTKNGVGAFSIPSPVLTPLDPTILPGVPAVTLAMSPQAGRAKLTWNPPSANTGAPVTSYIVRYRVAGTDTWRAVRRTTEIIVFQGLISGRDYEFQVRAENISGAGAVSEIFTVRIL